MSVAEDPFKVGPVSFDAAAGTSFDVSGDPFAQTVSEWDLIQAALVDEMSDPENGAKRVLTEVERAFKERASKEAERYRQAVDGEFWICVVFQTREQKEQFLSNIGIDRILHGDKYIDGWDMAKALKVPLDRASMRYNISDKLDRKLIDLARDPSETGLGSGTQE